MTRAWPCKCRKPISVYRDCWFLKTMTILICSLSVMVRERDILYDHSELWPVTWSSRVEHGCCLSYRETPNKGGFFRVVFWELLDLYLDKLRNGSKGSSDLKCVNPRARTKNAASDLAIKIFKFMFSSFCQRDYIQVVSLGQSPGLPEAKSKWLLHTCWDWESTS